MISLDDVIIENDRDRKTLIYLIKVLGKERITQTLSNFTGGKRFYVSNIAKANKIEVPDHIYHVPVDQEEVRQILDDLRKKLKI